MDEFIIKVKELCNEVDNLYVYGAGLYGQTMYQTLFDNGIKVDGFVITVCKEKKTVLGIPVVGVSDVLNSRTGTVSYTHLTLPTKLEV